MGILFLVLVLVGEGELDVENTVEADGELIRREVLWLERLVRKGERNMKWGKKQWNLGENC